MFPDPIRIRHEANCQGEHVELRQLRGNDHQCYQQIISSTVCLVTDQNQLLATSYTKRLVMAQSRLFPRDHLNWCNHIFRFDLR